MISFHGRTGPGRGRPDAAAVYFGRGGAIGPPGGLCRVGMEAPAVQTRADGRPRAAAVARTKFIAVSEPGQAR